MVGGGDPFYLKFGVNWPQGSEIADFEPIFARRASAVTISKKSSINTNRKSTMRPGPYPGFFNRGGGPSLFPPFPPFSLPLEVGPLKSS